MIKWKDKYDYLKLPNIPSANSFRRKYGEDIIKLNYNESNFGPSPLVMNYNYKLKNPHRYPDYHSKILIKKLVTLYNDKFNSKNFWISNGSDAILDAIPSLFSSKNDNVIIPSLTYGRILQTCIVQEINTKEIPLKNGYIDLKSILLSIDKKTSIIYLVNPNMPTGTSYSSKEMIDFIKKVPDNILIVLDEAYIEYSVGVQNSYLLDTKIIKKFDNVLITRTFSKMFAIAGYRIGYILASEHITTLFKKAIQAFPVSNISSRFAYKALLDIKYYENIVSINKEEKQIYYEFFDYHKVKYIKSDANFIYINTKNEKWLNKELWLFLLQKHGIWIRNVKDIGLRITIGQPLENVLVRKGIKEFLNGR